jgi:hypothetical protein
MMSTTVDEKNRDPEPGTSTLDEQPHDRDTSPDATLEKPKDEDSKMGKKDEDGENKGNIRDYFVRVARQLHRA